MSANSWYLVLQSKISHLLMFYWVLGIYIIALYLFFQLAYDSIQKCQSLVFFKLIDIYIIVTYCKLYTVLNAYTLL